MRVAKVNFNDYIGNDFFFGGISEAYVRYCVEGPGSADPAAAPAYPEAVELHFFNCPGGEVYEGYGIYSYLRQVAQAGTVVTAYIHGLCASIASLIVLAADERLVGPLGSTMIHKPLVDAGPYANADDHRRAAYELDRVEKQITDVYVARTGLPAVQLQALMRDETTFTAAEAVAHGFATGLFAADVPATKAGATAAVVKNYAKPSTPPHAATMPTLNETEEKGLFAKFKNWLNAEATPRAEAPAPAPAPAPAAAPAPAPAAAGTSAEIALSDGTSVYVDTSDDGIEDIDQGDAVFTDAALSTPVADGQYSLQDGRDFTVTAGIVTDLDADPAPAAVAPAAVAAPAAAAPVAPMAPQPSTPQARLKAAEARAMRAEAKLNALVPGSTGTPNKVGAQVFPEGAAADAHPLAGAAQKAQAILKAQF